MQSFQFVIFRIAASCYVRFNPAASYAAVIRG